MVFGVMGCGSRTAGGGGDETTTTSSGSGEAGSAGSTSAEGGATSATETSGDSDATVGTEDAAETGPPDTGFDESASTEETMGSETDEGMVDEPCDEPGTLVCADDWSSTMRCTPAPEGPSWQVEEACDNDGWGWCMEMCDFSPPGCIHTTICDWECIDRALEPGGACVIELESTPWMVESSVLRIDATIFEYVGQPTCDGITGSGWAGSEDSPTVHLCGEACDAWIGTKQAEFGHYCIAE